VALVLRESQRFVAEPAPAAADAAGSGT
jgi:hypothetical protein